MWYEVKDCDKDGNSIFRYVVTDNAHNKTSSKSTKGLAIEIRTLKPDREGKFCAIVHRSKNLVKGCQIPAFIYGGNLELLKLKCLLKAKDFGWKITKI